MLMIHSNVQEAALFFMVLGEPKIANFQIFKCFCRLLGNHQIDSSPNLQIASFSNFQIKTMAYYYIQHADYVAAGSLIPWASERGLELKAIKLFEEDYELPTVDKIDGLVILGGPMNIYEEAKYPFLKDCKKLIKEAIDVGVKNLGICLGGQLISDVLGAKVEKNSTKEIGWHNVSLKPESVFHDFKDPTPFFHWHGDVFDLPPNVNLLAQTTITPHQAYTYQSHVLALQFHPEVTSEIIHSYLNKDREEEELGTGPFAQTAEEIIERTKKEASPNQERFWKILDRFFLAETV
jgi:GMP synthase-like glutamine amidotransferase